MTASDGRFGDLPGAARAALAELLQRADPSVAGIVLTGSAARGLATERSDIDVIVVRESSDTGREITRSAAIDEIPMTLAALETVRAIGSPGAWERWSFAWAQILRDTSDGRVAAAVRRQASLAPDEVRALLLERARMDEFLNFAYRAAKSHRDGRPDAARLDLAEGVAALLDVVFALSGRVRPYNKYLAWELAEHPLADPAWQAEPLLRLVDGLLAGREDAGHAAVRAIEAACRADPTLGRELAAVIDAWGPDLALMRGDQPR